MKISYNWLQSFFNRKLPTPVELADLLTMHSFEAESVEKTRRDWILEIDVLPNRAHDCLSHWGIAREIAAIIGVRPLERDKSSKGKASLKESKSQKIADFLKVEVKDKELCPRYCARAMVNIKVGPSPQWLKERLEAIGQKSINNVVDATNYVMFELGQPLHAFDADKLVANNKQLTIVVRQAKKSERITTLEDEEYELEPSILVIADTTNPLAIAGIKGGKKAEISQMTKNIILEAANFSPAGIRQTSKKLGLRTESSMRFEHGLDLNLASQAIDRVAGLIQELAGGEVIRGIVDVYPRKARSKKIKLEVERVKRLLGVDISVREIKSILERLGFDIGTVLEEQSLAVTVPTWRMDISIPEDLIEEIGRFYGYEKIPAQLPTATLIPPVRNESLIYENKVRDILTGVGFNEVYNYSFISEKDVSCFGFQIPDLMELENPVSREQKYLRPSLIPNLLKNVRDNLRYFDEIRLFEIGKVFQRTANSQQLTVNEEKKLGAVMVLKGQPQKAQEFYRLKGVADSLLNKLRISDIWYDDIPETCSLKTVTQVFHSARKAEIKVGNELIGWLGEINPEILEKLDIKSRMAAFELDFEKLVQLATEERIYMPPLKYPAVVRDIAILVEPGTKVVEVLNLINAAGGSLVRDIDLFDIYEGEGIPEGKKNLAFHIIYQADDHTLTDKEVDQIHSKIVWVLENEGGWEVRR
jgi:phenylalanyl-tRNA synthetase beta chain